MDLRIMSHPAACGFLSIHRHEWDVICIVNSDGNAPLQIRTASRLMLPLVFDDIDYPMKGFILPQKDDVQKALEFAADKNRLIVTCQGGMSRSAALGYVILCQRLGAHNAIKYLIPVRHHPNRRIINLAEELTEDRSIYKHYNEWVQKPIYTFPKLNQGEQ